MNNSTFLQKLNRLTWFIKSVNALDLSLRWLIVFVDAVIVYGLMDLVVQFSDSMLRVLSYGILTIVVLFLLKRTPSRDE